MTREEAVKVIDGRFEIMDYCENEKLEEALDMAIKALEQSERKKGKWLRSGSCIFPYECDQCGDTNERATPFCPNCGADMGEGDSE